MHFGHKYLIGACILLGTASPICSQASGLGVSPANLKVYISREAPGQAVFSVSNPDSEIQIFEIYPDEPAKYLKITPQVFSLNPGSAKLITIEVSSEAMEDKNHARSYVSVVSRPLSDSNMQIASGAKILLEIFEEKPAKAMPNKNLFIGFVALGSLLAAAAWQKINT